ncbi:NTP transferase domain-containing protein [Roseibium sediminis]|uniref:NTP transferase domain-containing protein n=1 Tax=Roseibium sediminis TaxID=1775174 RepID=UPI00123DF159|nr:molybdopterin-binding/glycosyltransferase family 2 protein [Roseibium sediminis]
MEFGPVPIGEAEGCVLAHSTQVSGRTLKKGHVLTGVDVRGLAVAGIESITVARLSADDTGEDEAAHKIAQAADGGGMWLDAPFTGRVNLYADAPGVFVADETAVNSLNRVDPSITLATLPNFARVSAGRMVATAKIIPFAASNTKVREAETLIAKGLRVYPFRSLKVGLIATQLDHLKPATMDKTRRVLQQRLDLSNSSIICEKRVPHSAEAVAEAMRELKSGGAELLILFGASAVVDRKDILPSAIEVAGGRVRHFGMPVDPGNLLLLGELDDTPVIGAPGCARSPRENGFDWVLDRILADIPVTAHDLSGMGVGGLLMEIESRPQPREIRSTSLQPRIGAVVLAAGKSSRMGGPNKLLAHLDGKPVLRHVVEAAIGADLAEIAVVYGHMHDRVQGALADLPVIAAYNPDYADGMASSIRTGMNALSPELDGVLILLGDMPRITTGDMKALTNAMTETGKGIVMATADGKRGNPVLWDRRFFADLRALEGDIGGRNLVSDHPEQVAEVEIGGAARLDLDTPQALLDAGGILPE